MCTRHFYGGGTVQDTTCTTTVYNIDHVHNFRLLLYNRDVKTSYLLSLRSDRDEFYHALFDTRDGLVVLPFFGGSINVT